MMNNSQEELVGVLKSLKAMEPFNSYWKHFSAFRIINFEIEKHICPTIELLDDFNEGGMLLYHEMSQEITNYITCLLCPYGKSGTYLTYHVPDDILIIEKALAQIMPELNSNTVIVDYRKNAGCFFKSEEEVSLKILEPLKLMPPNGVLTVDEEISSWFLEIQKMWKSPGIRQSVRISSSEYNRVTTVFQSYDAVCETVQRNLDAKVIKRVQAERERKRIRLQMEVEKRKQQRDQERVERDTKIQQAGAEGEKKVDYVLECMGPNTIRVKDNTVNNYGRSCIMLQSDSWAKIPQEYDHILIRENGVFLIETKNLSGKIEIDQFGNWTQTKEETGHAIYAIESPTFQIYRHEKLIHSFLPSDVPVTSIICLANPRVIVKGQENCQYPVLRWDLLAQYIEEQPSKITLSREDMEALHEQIKAHYYECSDNSKE